MITLTREEAEQVLKLLDTFDTFNDFTDVREPLRAKLSEYPENFIDALKFHTAMQELEPEPIAYINVEERKLEWATPIKWETPTVVKMDKVPLYTAPPSAPIPKMREMLEVQGREGNWNYDSYMHGMYNGMEYMLAMVESREPVFREAKLKEKNGF